MAELYNLKNSPVECMQWTGNNLDELMAWSNMNPADLYKIANWFIRFDMGDRRAFIQMEDVVFQNLFTKAVGNNVDRDGTTSQP